MRRVVALLVPLILVLGQPVQAQSLLALRGGLNFASLGGDDEDNPDSRTGLNLGASYLVPVSTNVGIQFGAAYSQKGAESTEEGIDVKLSLDYLEFPVLLNLVLPLSGSLSAHAVLGPAVAIEVGCEAAFSTLGGVSTLGVTVTFDCSEIDADTKTFDFGAVVGAGLVFAASDRVSALVDLSYNLGLTSIDDSGGDTKNKALTLQAGVGFSVGN